MKSFLPSILLFFLISSCVHYSTVSAINNPGQKIAIQDYYSPCCGSCGERIVIEEKKGEQYLLQINCNIENEDSRLCSPYRIGTQKQVLSYKNNKVLLQSFFKPVYDTIELKKMFPNVDRGEYFDSSLAFKAVFPLGRMDSLLIDKYLGSTKKTGCNSSYLMLIKGFVQVDLDPKLFIDTKKIKFKSK